MKYNNHLNYRDRRRLLLKLKIVYAVLGLAIIGGGIYFYFNYAKDNIINDKTVSQKTNSVIAPSISTFKSPYFQFQAQSSWVEIPQESTPNKFVYRSYNKNLLEHELVIYVNQIPDPMNFRTTRVLPVGLIPGANNNNKFSAEKVSEPCGVALDKNAQIKDVQTVDYKGVKFTCFGKYNEYNVIVGQKGGESNITMKRKDGTTAVYTLRYKDLRATNSSVEIDQIVSTFQSL